MDINPLSSLTDGYARSLLDDLQKAGTEPRARVCTLTLGGWKGRVEVSPAPPAELVPGLNPCGRAVLTLLWDAEGPLSVERVREALEDRKLGLFGEVTVRRALRLLHREHKVVCLSTHRPRGYYLPQRLPLFRVKPQPDDDDQELDH